MLIVSKKKCDTCDKELEGVTHIPVSSTCKEETSNTNSLIQDLIHNPIFHLSLSSKELFHSNFLLWLAYNHTDFFNNILHNCFKVNESFNFNTEDHIALREFKNLDFCICDKLKKGEVHDFNYIPSDDTQDEAGEILFVLENKFKSLPYLAQLNNYERKVINHNKKSDNKVHFVLLTLTQDLPWMKIQNECEQNRWVHVTYGDYANSLNSIDNFSLGKDSFSVELIKRYKNFIEVFSDYMVKNIPSGGDLSNKTWTIMSSNSTMKKLRTDDIWQKLVASSIASLIEYCLKQQNINGVFNNLGVKELLASGIVKIGTIYISIGFSRGTALIDVKKKINDKIIYGVQIQNGYYKRVLESVDSIVPKYGSGNFFARYLKDEAFMNKFKCLTYVWKDSNSKIFAIPEEIHPKVSHVCKAGLKGFGGYGRTFVCQSKVLDSNALIKDIVYAIIEDMK